MATIYSGSDAGKSGLEMVELDGAPDVRGITKINVSNTTLTDDGNGEVTLITGGGGGGSGTVTSITVSDGTFLNLTATPDPITTTGSITADLSATGTPDATTFLRGDNTWATPAGGSGTVTSVAMDGGTTGLTYTGSPITTNGTITLGGTLVVANGGTGSTTAAGARTNLGLGSTDDVTFNNVEIDGNLNHDGSNIGFFGTAPVAGETVDGPLTQGFDPGAASPNETALAGAIESLGQALAAYGLITYNP